ncbi:MAG: bifunctional phosphoribosyl-AMP cyclohydrolase/phosphoribosyl-ATP diphosphatase HisIE [Acidobacteriia bacterium]|nr:bifunctional phosphoribosyl-AMP cyclohydrolase/phosphoribosyl-ATP diphosphatase HisIE [Terriglobia bacterium]
MNDELFSKLKFDPEGLIPAVVQDATTKKLLTLAYMNRESLEKTLETRETWFWSRSRKELWHKGATSGNTQRVERLVADCDGDALLIEVTPRGPACHTGAESCFDTSVLMERWGGISGATSSESADIGKVLAHLTGVIQQRKRDLPEGSYTTSLFRKGLDHIAKKVAEESTETILAAKGHQPDQIVYETADLLYHLLVLLQAEDIPLEKIAQELAARFGKKKEEYPR